ncbi:MAG: hypothetical protein AB7O28_11525 [Vicinamibacterales bacterium]
MTKMLGRLALAGACSMLGLGTASALPLADVQVPFAFTVEGVQLPAGRYEVERIGDDASTIAILNAHRQVEAILLTAHASQAAPGDMASMTFVKGAHGYELRTVRDDDGERWTVPSH